MKNLDMFDRISIFVCIRILPILIILIIFYQFVCYPYFYKHKNVPFVNNFAIVKNISSETIDTKTYKQDSIFIYNDSKLIKVYSYKYIECRDLLHGDKGDDADGSTEHVYRIINND